MSDLAERAVKAKGWRVPPADVVLDGGNPVEGMWLDERVEVLTGPYAPGRLRLPDLEGDYAWFWTGWLLALVREAYPGYVALTTSEGYGTAWVDIDTGGGIGSGFRFGGVATSLAEALVQALEAAP